MNCELNISETLFFLSLIETAETNFNFMCSVCECVRVSAILQIGKIHSLDFYERFKFIREI